MSIAWVQPPYIDSGNFTISGNEFTNTGGAGMLLGDTAITPGGGVIYCYSDATHATNFAVGMCAADYAGPGVIQNPTDAGTAPTVWLRPDGEIFANGADTGIYLNDGIYPGDLILIYVSSAGIGFTTVELTAGGGKIQAWNKSYTLNDLENGVGLISIASLGSSIIPFISVGGGTTTGIIYDGGLLTFDYGTLSATTPIEFNWTTENAITSLQYIEAGSTTWVDCDGAVTGTSGTATGPTISDGAPRFFALRSITVTPVLSASQPAFVPPSGAGTLIMSSSGTVSGAGRSVLETFTAQSAIVFSYNFTDVYNSVFAKGGDNEVQFGFLSTGGSLILSLMQINIDDASDASNSGIDYEVTSPPTSGSSTFTIPGPGTHGTQSILGAGSIDITSFSGSEYNGDMLSSVNGTETAWNNVVLSSGTDGVVLNAWSFGNDLTQGQYAFAIWEFAPAPPESSNQPLYIMAPCL